VPAASSIVEDTKPRTLRLRLLPGTRANGEYLAGLAGANRAVWNHFVALNQERSRHHRNWRDYRIGPEPAPPQYRRYSMQKEFTQLRREWPWLQKYSSDEVRYCLKYLEDTYKAHFKDPEEKGWPKFKAKHFATPAFTVSQGKIQSGCLWIPKCGWMRLQGERLYAGCQVKTVRVRQEGSPQRPKWYAYVCYDVPVSQLRQGAQTGIVGVDRGVTDALMDSCGEAYRMPDVSRLEAKKRRYERIKSRRRKGSARRRRIVGRLAKIHRKIRRIRDTATHLHSRQLADKAHTIVFEYLKIKQMTKSAKGTQADPGQNVKAKAGLNREILAAGWGGTVAKTSYKAGRVLQVPAAYTSQTCSRCGCVAKESRQGKRFRCIDCDFMADADQNASVNIERLGREQLIAQGIPRDAVWPMSRGPLPRERRSRQRPRRSAEPVVQPDQPTNLVQRSLWFG